MRYLHLYKYYFSKNVKSRLSYRLDAFIGIFGFLIENIILFSTLYLTVSTIPSLGGWTVNMLGFLYGFYLIPKSIDHIFTDNVWQLANGGITRGILDKYLIRPLSPLFQLIAEMVQFEGLGEFILGIVLLFIYTPLVIVDWSFINIFLIILCVISATLFFFSIKLIFGSLSFWTKRSIEVMTLIYDFSNFSKYPIGIFNQMVRTILTFVIPFSVVIFLPVEALLMQGNLWMVTLYTFTSSIMMLIIGLFMWFKGLKKYESAGN